MKVGRLTSAMLAAELDRVERHFGLPASEFYDRYRQGLMGDSIDVIEAAGLCYLALRRGVLAARARVPA